ESRRSGKIFPRAHFQELRTRPAPRGQNFRPRVAGFEAEGVLDPMDGGSPARQNGCRAAHGANWVADGWVAPPVAWRRYPQIRTRPIEAYGSSRCGFR